MTSDRSPRAPGRLIRRHADRTRLAHWTVALLFFCAALSGLAVFHPALFPLATLFGGGPWDRVLHPFLGVLMCLAFLVIALQVWRDNRWAPRDWAWLKAAPSLMASADERRMPAAGKFNGGQKAVFWMFAASLATLLATGFVFWQPWFADGFPIPLRRVAVVLHAASAVVLILAVVVHVYAAVWVKGTIRAMTRGTVTADWARRNHPAWVREMPSTAGRLDAGLSAIDKE